MPKNSVLQRPQRKGNLPRNGFDRGYETKFNLSAGLLLPVFCEPVLGNSHLKINRQQIMRAAQLNTAAMPRMDMHLDFYFVPFRQLYSYYGQSRTGTKDSFSSKLGKIDSTEIPFLRSDVLDRLMEDGQGSDDLGYPYYQGSLRLLDMFNMGVTAYDDSQQEYQGYESVDLSLPQMNPLKLCAYQKVYYDHYRLSNYEANDPEAYNLDKFVTSAGLVTPVSYSEAFKMAKIHYVPYRKDYMNNVYPSLNFAASSDTQLRSSFKVANNVIGASFRDVDEVVVSDVYGQADSLEMSPNLPVASIADQGQGSVFSAQTIRALFALDKMTRLAAYAPQHVADQFEARFGFRPVAEDMNESIRIGSFRADMSISEVLSTAVTEGADLGTLGGRGLSIDDWGKTLEFNCKEEGLVIGVAYILPRIAYDSFMIDSFNTILDWSDMPQPEMENLGLEPFYQQELFIARSENDANTLENHGMTLLDFNSKVRGYRPSWQRWKLGFDQNHGLFNSGLALNHFTTHTKIDYIRNKLMKTTADGFSYQYFLCDPADLDSVFVQNYLGSQYYDQFFGMIRIGFSAIQNMPVLGIPDL